MRTVVAVLRGGPSSEYEVSLKSGAAVLEALDREKYDPLDIFISKTGEWHRRGVAISPDRAVRGVDVAWNALHGEYGESGVVQKLLDMHQIPYTGAGAFQSALAFNKYRTKEALKNSGILMPRHALLERDRDMSERRLLELFRSFPQPCIVKPAVGGSSIGMTLARDFYTLAMGLDRAFEVSPKVIIEEFIKGKDATVGVVDELRGKRVYPLLPVEIVPPPTSPFFDYAAKYGGQAKEICPGRFSESEKKNLMETARKVHEHLELAHYSRSDFVVSKRGIYFLEVNPAAAIGLTKESLMPKALRAVGLSLQHFIDHVLDLARRRK